MDIAGPLGDVLGNSVINIARVLSCLLMLGSIGYVSFLFFIGSKESNTRRYEKQIAIGTGLAILLLFVLIALL